MKYYKVMAHINSLNGDMAEVTVIDENRENAQTIYTVIYKDVICTAICNVFNGHFYADDIYGKVLIKWNLI